ncbi:MAG: hypothetical protein IKC72_02880 [Clostridia bacterium]|nr:hypothetical protein [Clostridia bacterium]
MKIRFLGSGTAGCKIKKKNTKEFRRRTTLFVDEKILINPTMDIFDFEATFNLTGMFRRISAILVTDTLSLDIEAVRRLTQRTTIPVLASAFVLNQLSDCEGVRAAYLTPFNLTQLGEYKILPLPLGRKTEIARECPLGFYISRDKNLFYATPGGMLRYDAWQLLGKLGADESMKLDIVVLDGSRGDAPYGAEDFEALSLEGAVLTKRTLQSGGVAAEHCRFIVANLPTDKKKNNHEEWLPYAEENGLTLCYDGYFTGM